MGWYFSLLHQEQKKAMVLNRNQPLSPGKAEGDLPVKRQRSPADNMKKFETASFKNIPVVQAEIPLLVNNSLKVLEFNGLSWQGKLVRARDGRLCWECGTMLVLCQV